MLLASQIHISTKAHTLTAKDELKCWNYAVRYRRCIWGSVEEAFLWLTYERQMVTYLALAWTHTVPILFSLSNLNPTPFLPDCLQLIRRILVCKHKTTTHRLLTGKALVSFKRTRLYKVLSDHVWRQVFVWSHVKARSNTCCFGEIGIIEQN